MTELIDSPLVRTIRVASDYGQPFEAILQLVFVTDDIVYIVGLLAPSGNVRGILSKVRSLLKAKGVKEYRYFRYNRRTGTRVEITRCL